MEQIETIIDNGELSAKELHKYLVNTPDAFFTNIKEVEENLKDLASKYQDFVVDRKNLKKEAHDTKMIFKNTRLGLQNMQESAIKKAEEIKKGINSKFNELYSIIKPLEQRLQNDINAISMQIKEEKQKAENREKEILKKLDDWQFKLEQQLNQNDLSAFEILLAELESEFDTFDEHTFQAKRIHAIFKGRKNEIPQRIEAQKAIEELEKHLLEMLAMRKQNLQDLGGELIQGGIKFNLSIGTVLDAKLKSMNQEEFQDFLRKIRAEISTKEILAQRQEQEERLKIENEFKALYETYIALGGDTSKVKKEATIDNIKVLKIEVTNLHRLLQEARSQAVKIELIEFTNFVDEFSYKLQMVVEGTSFEHEESRQNCLKFLQELKRIKETYL